MEKKPLILVTNDDGITAPVWCPGPARWTPGAHGNVRSRAPRGDPGPPASVQPRANPRRAVQGIRANKFPS